MKKGIQVAGLIFRVGWFVLCITLLLFSGYYWVSVGLIASRWFLVLLGVGLLVYYFRKKLRIKLALVAIVILALVGEWSWYATQFARPEPIDTTSIMPLTVMSCNLYFKNKNLPPALELLQSHPVDILVLQEVNTEWLNLLQKELLPKYAYAKFYAQDNTHGFGVLSQFPLELENFMCNVDEQEVAQCMKIEIPGKPLYLCNIHLSSSHRAIEKSERFFSIYERKLGNRQEEWKAILQNIQSIGKGISRSLIVGDANTMDITPLYRIMRKDYIDAYAISNWGYGFTFPNNRVAYLPPVARLDYIFTKGPIHVKDAKVLTNTSSDHLPVMAELEI